MKFKLLILTALLSFAPLKVLADAPIQPEVAQHLNEIESQTGSRVGWVRQVRAVYDSTLSGMGTVAGHGLGVYLPANSTILRGWGVIGRPFNSGGTLAVSCEDANNILSAVDLSTANYTSGTLFKLAPQDTVATVVKGTTIAAQCQITATVGTAAQGTGKLTIWLEYFVSE